MLQYHPHSFHIFSLYDDNAKKILSQMQKVAPLFVSSLKCIFVLQKKKEKEFW